MTASTPVADAENCASRPSGPRSIPGATSEATTLVQYPSADLEGNALRVANIDV
jgi:hypothetical protein